MKKAFPDSVYSKLSCTSETLATYQNQVAAKKDRMERDEREMLYKKEKEQKMLEIRVTELISNPEFFTVFDAYKKATHGVKQTGLPLKMGVCQTFHYGGNHDHGSPHWEKTDYGVIILEKTLAMYLGNKKVDAEDGSAMHQRLLAFEFVTGVASPKTDNTTLMIGLSKDQLEEDLLVVIETIEADIKKRVK